MRHSQRGLTLQIFDLVAVSIAWDYFLTWGCSLAALARDVASLLAAAATRPPNYFIRTESACTLTVHEGRTYRMFSCALYRTFSCIFINCAKKVFRSVLYVAIPLARVGQPNRARQIANAKTSNSINSGTTLCFHFNEVLATHS